MSIQPGARRAWNAFALLTGLNLLLLGGGYAYYRTLYIDFLIDQLSVPGIPNIEIEETLIRRQEDSIPRLAKVLASDDHTVELRTEAAKILGSTGTLRAAEILNASLDHSDWQIRKAAARGLGRIAGPNAFAPLTRALADESPSVRVQAVAGLANCFTPQSAASSDQNPAFLEQALDLVLAPLEDPDPLVRGKAQEVLQGLVHLPFRPDNPILQRAQQALHSTP